MKILVIIHEKNILFIVKTFLLTFCCAGFYQKDVFGSQVFHHRKNTLFHHRKNTFLTIKYLLQGSRNVRFAHFSGNIRHSAPLITLRVIKGNYFNIKTILFKRTPDSKERLLQENRLKYTCDAPLNKILINKVTF